MLSPLWLLPLAVGAAAVVPLWRGIQGLVGEAAELRASIEALRALRLVLAEVNAEITTVRTTVAAAPRRNLDVLPPRYTANR